MTTIVKILSIRDTRAYEEQGDRWVPIPGSGHENQCARCGRQHEVHATVLLSDGTEAVVGTGCASKDNVETAKRFTSLDRAVKRLARLEAEQADYLKRRAEWDRNWKEVMQLTPPEITFKPSEQKYGRPDPKREEMVMGDVQVCCWNREYSTRYTVLSVWRDKRMTERGLASPRTATYQLEKQIRKLRSRIEQLKTI